MYLNMNHEKVSALAYSGIFFLRRAVFVFLTFGLSKYPHLQIQLFIALSVAYICYLN